MAKTLIYLDADSTLDVHNEIRQKHKDGILTGALPPGHKLPSSRALAEQLDVSRNTVVLAYQQLVAEGYLESRARSGIFVSRDMLETRVGPGVRDDEYSELQSAAWRRRIRRPGIARRAAAPELPNWSRYPYPFIDGEFDASLFPLAEWREASRLALSVRDVREWSTGAGDADVGGRLDRPVGVVRRQRPGVAVARDDVAPRDPT